jgi:hypothetical protein
VAGWFGLMLFETSRQVGRIPIVLVQGTCAASTRLFINMWVASQAFADSVLIGVKQEALEPLKHDRVVELPRLEVSAQDNCLCCGLHGALGDCLRSIFFEALNHRSKRLDRVLIASDSIATSQLAHTLRHTPFLGQRYIHQWTIRVVSVTFASNASTSMSSHAFPSLDSLRGLDSSSYRARQMLIFISSKVCGTPAQFNAWATEVKQNLPYQEVFYLNIEEDHGIDLLQIALGFN